MEEKIRILVVDDEPHFLESTKKRLELRGFVVFGSGCGEDAVALSDHNYFHAAIVDLKMPGLNGIDTMLELKKKINGIEVIILTGHGSENASEKCMKSGAFAFLHKPCPMDEMIDVLLKASVK